MSPIKPVADSQTAGVFRPWTRCGDRRGKSDTLSPTVTIFGAGIAGLSAAHELIERGFSVQVVEPTRSPDDEYGMEVGGLARNQFGRVPEDPLVLHGPEPTDPDKLQDFRDNLEKVLLLRTTQMRRVQRRFPVQARIVFDRGTTSVDENAFNAIACDDWGVRNGRKLDIVWQTIKDAYKTYAEEFSRQPRMSLWYYEQGLPQDWRCREILYVEIRGHTDGDLDEVTNRSQSLKWACRVRDSLQTLNTRDQEHPSEAIPPLDFPHHFKCVGVGSAEPVGDQRDEIFRRRSNRVEFRIVEELVPGEHGYRFFPAFYRHLFDTMRRTPILDAQQRETGQTAWDRLVETRQFGLAPSDGQAPATVETRRARSLEELRRLSELFYGRIGATHRDIVRFQVRMLKYLTSSSERRRREYQDQSWWTYIGGDVERGYSEKMTRYLLEAPQALVAMNAEETDARSQGNIVSQLQLHYLENRFDYTLNGPTSQVWLRDWKRYLKRQGVRFFLGELTKLTWQEPDDQDSAGNKSELVPVTGSRSGWLEIPATRKDVSAQPPCPDEKLSTSSPKDPLAVFTKRPPRPKVAIEVLGADRGDYTVLVDRSSYTHSVDDSPASMKDRLGGRHDIAKVLAKCINKHPAVSADAKDTHIDITEKKEEIWLDLPETELEFDDSFAAGEWKEVRPIGRAALVDDISQETRDYLEERIRKAFTILSTVNDLWDQLPREDGTNPALTHVNRVLYQVNATCNFLLCDAEFFAALETATAEDEKTRLYEILNKRIEGSKGPGEIRSALNGPLFNNENWVQAGLLRSRDPAFNKSLSELERVRRPRREFVPEIETKVAENKFVLRAPEWVLAADGRIKDGTTLNFAPLFPYYFRSKKPSSSSGDGSIWIRVRNANDLLSVTGEPVPEDPGYDYRSESETREAFQPDFYVLALPFDKASTLLWRAEDEQPACLDGCLAELLDFDRHAYRRSQTGEELPVIRDAYGRPPRMYPLRDFAGVQYYFHHQIRIGKGHLFLPDAEWGLSSISQVAYWRERMSPTGPFMGQLSVDIGNFYALAPPRNSGRLGRTAWHSTFNELVTEVWDEVRLSLERVRAGVLVPPDYVHLDQALRFDDPRGSSFREEVSILVGDPSTVSAADGYAIWINGHRCCVEKNEKTKAIAEALVAEIENVPSGGIRADHTPRRLTDFRPESVVHKIEGTALDMVKSANLQQLVQLEAAELRNPRVYRGRKVVLDAIRRRTDSLSEEPTSHESDNGPYVVTIQSTVPPGTALVSVMRGDPGSYELEVGDKCFRYSALPRVKKAVAPGARQSDTPAQREHRTRRRCRKIRNVLFKQLMQDANLPVTAALSGDTGLLLLPRATDQLPPIMVRNDRQNLNVTFGPMLNVRLKQSDSGLSFANIEEATIGYNTTPFLINVPSQWGCRPGVLQPDRLSFEERRTDLGLDEGIFYRISNRRWVAAGTYMATTTRLTTMESANESGRHAVNAILERLLLSRTTDYNAGGRMFGDWVDIWDPEKYELDDLEPLKRLDRTLVTQGLPHFLDILNVIDATDALPMNGKASGSSLANMVQLVLHATDASSQDWGSLKETAKCLITHFVEQAQQSGFDPSSILRGASIPADLRERLKQGISSLLKAAGGGGN